MKILEERIWRQTAFGLLSILSIIFLYSGGVRSNSIMTTLGLLLLGIGMLSNTIMWLINKGRTGDE